MGRSWQYIGFSQAARKLLGETVRVGTRVVIELDLQGHPTNTYTQDIFRPNYTKEERDRVDPFCGEEHVFYTYTFDDGRVWEDYTQAEPWSSGPCTFMALRDVKTKEPIAESLWPQANIDAA